MRRREMLKLGAGGALLPLAAPLSAETGRRRLVAGPMLGAPAPDRLRVWAQANEPCRLQLEVRPGSGAGETRLSPMVEVGEAEDCCAVLEVAGLAADSDYHYRVLVEGVPDPYLGRLLPLRARTAPPEGERRAFRLAFGSCARYAEDPQQPIWQAVQAARPDLFLWLGDNIYAESPSVDSLRREYRRQRAVPGFQPLARSVPQLAIWDDNDYGLNDSDRTSPIREDALAVFKRYWANPAYGLPAAPGVFFQQSYGAVELFCLDDRYWRDPNGEPDGPDKTLLGQAQREWLLEGLKRSRAVFKLIACGCGWSRAKGPGEDAWSAFLYERDVLFDAIRDFDIEGVVLLSGDTHVGELNVIPWSERGGYDLYDLVSSPLAQRTSRSWLDRHPEQRVRPVHFASANFGWIAFEFGDDPLLRFHLVDPLGRTAWAPFELRASQLRRGVQSWKGLADPALLPGA